MSKRVPIFVLQGYFGTGNFGDDWLLVACVAAISKARPDARFIVRDHGDETRMVMPPGVIFSGSERILGRPDASRAWRLGRYALEAWRQFRGVDWLVFGGGTQFHGGHGIASIALNALLALLARVRGARVAIFGCGIKDIDGFLVHCLLNVILRSASVIIVRDEGSAALAGKRALRAADLAFTAPLPEQAIRGAALAIAVYPTSWNESIANAIAGATTGRDVVLLTLQRTGVAPGDVGILDELAARLGPAATRRDMSDSDRALANVGIVCGMRFHALLAAAQARIPFVGIAHDPKIADLCARFGMPCLAPSEVTTEALSKALDEAALIQPSEAALDLCRKEATAGVAAMIGALA